MSSSASQTDCLFIQRGGQRQLRRAKCSVSLPPKRTKAWVCVCSETPRSTPLHSAEGHAHCVPRCPRLGFCSQECKAHLPYN